MTQSRTYNYEDGFKKYLNKTFSTIAIGVAISAICAFLASKFVPIIMIRTPGLSAILAIAMIAIELGIAVYFSARLNNMSTQTAWLCYIVYSIVTGISFSTIILAYARATVTYAFIATTVLFVCMAIIGYTTNINYTKVYALLLPGVLAGFIMSLLNVLVFRSPWIDMMIVYVGIILFLAITAADVQKLRSYYYNGSYSNELTEKFMILGAFQLYLDFVNLFIKIVQIFARRESNRRE